MRILLDVMGADNPPRVIIEGAVRAKEKISSDITLVGDEKIIRGVLSECGASEGEFDIAHSDTFITMEDSPLCVVKDKKDSSMGRALTLLAEGKGDAVVSCGNTGALFSGATLIVRRAKGVRRAALATVLPYRNNVMLLDSGANVTVTPDYFVHFAHLGSAYMKKVYGIENPRVAIVNNGEEAHKGTPLVLEAKQLLLQEKNVNYIGSVEGQQLPCNACDVALCDGFTGNAILKASEGLATYIPEFTKNLIDANQAADENTRRIIDGVCRRFDFKEYGGAVMLGISKPVVKAHGRSDAHALENALLCAENYIKADVIGDFEKAAEDINVRPIIPPKHGGEDK